MLPNKFFLWPYEGDSLDQAIADLTPLFSQSGLSLWMTSEGISPLTGDIVEFVALLCREWNVSPWWLITSAQREQSAMSNMHLDTKATVAWLGVVNADVGRTTAPGFYGVYAQVARFVETTAWLLGVEPSDKWPEYVRTRKTAPRYQLGRALDVEKNGATISVVPLSAGDFMQLAYTPHYDVLRVNEQIARERTPASFF